MDDGEGKVGYYLDSWNGVGIGLDIGRVDVFVDDRATRMQTDNRNGHNNRETTIAHSVRCCSGTRTDNHKMGHGLVASARDKTMPDAGDNTINIHLGTQYIYSYCTIIVIFIVFIVVSIVFVRLASGDNSCNELIVLHDCSCCFITRGCAMKIRREFLV